MSRFLGPSSARSQPYVVAWEMSSNLRADEISDTTANGRLGALEVQLRHVDVCRNRHEAARHSSTFVRHDVPMPVLAPVSVDARIHAAALPGFPVVTRRGLRARGVDHRAIARRVADGRLVELWHDTFTIGVEIQHAPHDLLLAAAVATGGDHAALDGVTALQHRGLWNRRERTIHVATTLPLAPIDEPGVRFHRRSTMRSELVDMLPVRPATDAILAAAVERTPHELAFMIYQGQYERAVSIPELVAAVDASGHGRWVSRVRRAIELRQQSSAGTRCRSEDVLLPHASAAFGEPLVNVMGAAGIPGHEPDFCWPDRRWIVEIDGDQHLDDPDQRRNDLARDALLRAAGWVVVRVYWKDVWRDPQGVVAHLRRQFLG